jgi:hypothetical protein
MQAGLQVPLYVVHVCACIREGCVCKEYELQMWAG